jgi:hypothetical protein
MLCLLVHTSVSLLALVKFFSVTYINSDDIRITTRQVKRDYIREVFWRVPRQTYVFFFFSGEGPRSRRHGRTAALRLIVQPYDEDEDDYYILSFS